MIDAIGGLYEPAFERVDVLIAADRAAEARRMLLAHARVRP